MAHLLFAVLPEYTHVLICLLTLYLSYIPWCHSTDPIPLQTKVSNARKGPGIHKQSVDQTLFEQFAFTIIMSFMKTNFIHFEGVLAESSEENAGWLKDSDIC